MISLPRSAYEVLLTGVLQGIAKRQTSIKTVALWTVYVPLDTRCSIREMGRGESEMAMLGCALCRALVRQLCLFLSDLVATP